MLTIVTQKYERKVQMYVIKEEKDVRAKPQTSKQKDEHESLT